jgi:hypothetical protein
MISGEAARLDPFVPNSYLIALEYMLCCIAMFFYVFF